jgi:23S rRNA pseudouridine1911/1915/1917 synthase
MHQALLNPTVRTRPPINLRNRLPCAPTKPNASVAGSSGNRELNVVRSLSIDSSSWPQRYSVAPDQAGQRLDVFLTRQLPTYSRAVLRRAIDAGHAEVDGARGKASQRLRAGSQVVVTQIAVPREGPAPQDIPLAILHEDDAIVVVDKPAGMIVHPAKGHWEGTLASALAHHFGTLSERGGPTRPGIVHRLDRDTSGVIVVAKNDHAHDRLAAQFKARLVVKEYLTIVAGVPDRDRDVIDEPIGKHPTHREKKAIRREDPGAREAVTHYEVVERFAGYAFLRVRPKTGRTHQIRIHLAHVGCPVLCDRLYGGRAQLLESELMPRDKSAEQLQSATAEPLLQRQALHAHRLTLTHPITEARMSFEALVPADMQRTLESLRRWRSLR